MKHYKKNQYKHIAKIILQLPVSKSGLNITLFNLDFAQCIIGSSYYLRSVYYNLNYKPN